MLSDSIKDFYSMEVADNQLAVLYVGASCVLVKTSDTIFLFDPATFLDESLDQLKKVDFLFYTHDHYDHFNLDSTLKIYNIASCIVFAEPKVYVALKEYFPSRSLINAKPGLKGRVKGFRLNCIKGKHVGPITLYHVSFEGRFSFFHGGDSGYVPLADFRDTTVAFLPTGYPSPTASPRDAYRMAIDLNPRFIVAFHGSKDEHKEFESLVKEGLPETKVYAPQPGEIIKITF
ncbi:MAG: hypothetical protein DRJ47_02210 [Thermoprotei archaeon]|nr:MAG: hypothetical protein DRJ47_02210 [Thermoprotei archaeon]